MIWIVCFFIAVGVLSAAVIASIVLATLKYNSRRLITPFNLLLVGTFVSALVLNLPICVQLYNGQAFDWSNGLLFSVHRVLQMFLADADFSFVVDNIPSDCGWIYAPYTLLSALLMVITPLLTFAVVLSFFKNLSAYRRYLQGWRRDVYVFSELNDRSLALAHSLKNNSKQPKRVVVFCHVNEDDDRSVEYIEKAKELNAILFKKDICSVNFAVHSQKAAISLLTIDNDDSNNANTALELIERYNKRQNTSLYVFSKDADNELILNTADKGMLKVRRVNEVRSLINRTLYDSGHRLFDSALTTDDGAKRISAVIVGMGQHGTEMVKALSWFCQMDGYSLEINAFDSDLLAQSKFSAMCPELTDDEHNTGIITDQDAYYKIKIHSGIDVRTAEFADLLDRIGGVSYVLVAMGSDRANVETAVALRSRFTGKGISPVIDAVVHDSQKKQALDGITNRSGQPYDICSIGDIETSYSEAVIYNSDVEAVALDRHLKWGEEEEFWSFEYNYRSSIASAIHQRMKRYCNIAGVDKAPAERTDDELWSLRKLEHRRWNAYMRSEGYVYGPQRNELAKTHHCLVNFDALSEADQKKDDD